MKKNLNQDDFESFLQQAADGHKMYPNDRVWQAIDEKMEHQRKWPALRFASALLVTIVMGVLFYAQPDKTELDKFATATKGSQAAVPRAASRSVVSQNFSAKPAGSDFSSGLGGEKTSPGLEEVSANAAGYTTENTLENTSMVNNYGRSLAMQTQANELTAMSTTDDDPELRANLFTNSDDVSPLLAQQPTVESRLFTRQAERQEMPQLIVDKAKAARAWRTQLYVTPSISYRFINETSLSAVPLAFSSGTQSKLKNLVNHRPLAGFEFGIAFVKPLSSTFNFRIGIQGNYRAFEIDGWNTIPAVASINVSNSTDNLNAVTSISNVNGNSQVTMRNSYLQLAAPVGFDLAVTRGKKVNVYLGASLQPTYTPSQKAHVLSSDYKYYMEQPDLMRKFSLNNSAEIGLRVQGKKLQYQVGPQIRYQVTPTTKKEYSIRENLIDYGFKIGISKTN